MAAVQEVPLSGVFRVVYFLATGIVTLFVVVTAIVAFYNPPDDSSPNVPGTTRITVQAASSDSRDHYNRNVSLIFTIASAGVFATGILGLGRRFNPLRAGLLLGALLLFLTGIGFWTQSSQQWIGFIMCGLVFAVLAAGYLWLEDGLPLGGAPVRRITIPPGGPGGAPTRAETDETTIEQSRQSPAEEMEDNRPPGPES